MLYDESEGVGMCRWEGLNRDEEGRNVIKL